MSNAPLVAQCPVQRHGLFQQGASASVLALRAVHIRQLEERVGDALPVAYRSKERQRLLGTFARHGCVALPPGNDAQQIEREGDARGVSQFPAQCQALLSQSLSIMIVALSKRQPRSSNKRLRPNGCCNACASHHSARARKARPSLTWPRIIQKRCSAAPKRKAISSRRTPSACPACSNDQRCAARRLSCSRSGRSSPAACCGPPNSCSVSSESRK